MVVRIHDKFRREHTAWSNMIQRCRTDAVARRRTTYAGYAGRGIRVAVRWRKFSNFLADMGRCPPGWTIERKNNNRGYTPRNCVWIPHAHQAANKRNNHRLTHRGATRHVSEWARRTGLHIQTILDRLRNGWSTARALTRPPRKARIREFRTGGPAQIRKLVRSGVLWCRNKHGRTFEHGLQVDCYVCRHRRYR